MKEILQQLVFLQGMDIELDEIDKSAEKEQTSLNNQSTELSKKEAKIMELETRHAEILKEHRTLEAEAADQMIHVRERQSKIMQVQTDREHTALLKEIEDAKKVAKEKEEQVVELIEEAEKLEADIEERKNLLKGEKKLFDEETEKVKAAIAKINNSRKLKEKARNARAQEIEIDSADLLKKYNALRKSRNGLAVIDVDDGVCHGCYMALPPQRYNMLLRGDQILECPSCQRLIYYKATLD